MFDPASRYAGLDIATLDVRARDGRTRAVRYVRRRFVPPPPDEAATLIEHTVIDGDRLDNVTARYLDDPEQFWRVCDANDTVHPHDLTEEAGRLIKITLPQF